MLKAAVKNIYIFHWDHEVVNFLLSLYSMLLNHIEMFCVQCTFRKDKYKQYKPVLHVYSVIVLKYECVF